MDNKLTLAVKEYAYSLGADLVGISNVERYANAPVKMSPNGILPTARSVTEQCTRMISPVREAS